MFKSINIENQLLIDLILVLITGYYRQLLRKSTNKKMRSASRLKLT